MDYRYTPKYVRETLNYQAGEIVKHGDYNRNLNLLNVAVDNNTEALRKLMNEGGVASLNAVALDDAILRRHREHVLEDNDEQVPSSKAVYQHVEEVKNNIYDWLLNRDNILSNQNTEMTNLNLRVQVVNSLISQYGKRADEIEIVGDHLRDQLEFTYGALLNSKLLLDAFYPVGTIYETTSTDLDTTTKMNAHFGGAWEVYDVVK